jgi:hypothetical protein
VIRIPVAYSGFDDFWDSNSAPIGPQGKLISGMTVQMREELRTRLWHNLPATPDGCIFYEAFADAVWGEYRDDSIVAASVRHGSQGTTRSAAMSAIPPSLRDKLTPRTRSVFDNE